MAEMYEIVYGFDIKVVIKAIFRKIFGFVISLILCIGLKSLYNYFVKLNIISKKQLMVDAISLYQLYK